MNEFEGKLHRTLVQLLLDYNHRELAAMVIDGDLEITSDVYRDNFYFTIGLPTVVYDIVVENESFKETIAKTMKVVSKGYDYNEDGSYIGEPEVAFRIKLVDVDHNWKDKVRELISNPKEANQGSIVERIFARDGKQVLLYNEMRFASKSEIRIAQELEARRVLFFPLPLAVRSDTGAAYMDHREPDFLICQEGVWGILEVSFHQPERYEKDSLKDIWFKKSGILCIQHYTAEKCFNYPSEVVDEFLQLLAMHKK
jgi:hypothetical protein